MTPSKCNSVRILCYDHILNVGGFHNRKDIDLCLKQNVRKRGVSQMKSDIHVLLFYGSMHSFAIVQIQIQSALTVVFDCSYEKIYYKLEVCFLLYLLSQIVTLYL